MVLTEQEELELLELEKQKYQAQLHTHPATEAPLDQRVTYAVAEQLGLPAAAVDPNNAVGLGSRFNLGLSGSTPEEQQAAFEQTQPEGTRYGGVEGYYAALPPGADQPIFMNPPGADWGDAAQLAGEAGPATVSGLGGGAIGLAMTGGNPLGGIVGGVIGASGGEGAREGYQTLKGTQRESAGKQAFNIGLAGALEGFARLLGAGGKAAGRWAKSAVTTRVAGVWGDIVQNSDPVALQKALDLLRQQHGITLPDLLNLQKSGNPVLQRMGRQALQMDDQAQKTFLKQAEDLAQIVRQETGVDNLVPADQYLHAVDREAGRLSRPAPVNEPAGGQALQESIGKTVSDRRAAMKDEYGKLTREAERLDPKFDISGLQDDLNRELGSREPMLGLSGAPNPIRDIKTRLTELDPLRGYSYKEIQDARGKVGEYLEMSPAKLEESGVNLGEAKKLYGDLTQVLENPQGIADPLERQAFIDQAATARGAASKFHDTFDVKNVSTITNQTRAGDLSGSWNLAKNRGTFDPAFVSLLREGDAAANQVLREQVTRDILSSSNPPEAFREYLQNPAATEFMFPTQHAKDQMLAQARLAKQFNKELAAKVEDDMFAMTDYGRISLETKMKTLGSATAEITGEGAQFGVPIGSKIERAAQIVRESEGAYARGHQHLREVVFDEVFGPALFAHPKTGNLVLDSKKLAHQIQSIKDKGYYEGILTQQDHALLDAALKFSRVTEVKGDAGTGLTIAAQVGRLRHGDPMAAASVFASKRMARMAASKTFGEAAGQIPLFSVLAVPSRIVAKGARAVAPGVPWLNRTVTTGMRLYLQGEGKKEAGKYYEESPPPESPFYVPPQSPNSAPAP